MDRVYGKRESAAERDSDYRSPYAAPTREELQRKKERYAQNRDEYLYQQKEAKK